MQIQTINKDEKNWSIFFEQIVKGNVIPVSGLELVRVGEKSSLQFLIDAFAELCGIEEGEMTTFSQLVYDKQFKNRDCGIFNVFCKSYAKLSKANNKLMD